jgi:hypothetical protein
MRSKSGTNTPNLLPAIKDAHADLLALGDRPVEWGGLMQAPRTVSSGEPVSRWYLLSYFLRKWTQAYAVACRKAHSAQARPTGFSLPASHPLRVYEQQAVKWASDPSLDAVLSEHLQGCLDGIADDATEINEVSVFRATVEAHEWCVMLAVLDAVAGQILDEDPGNHERPMLPRTSEAARDLAGEAHRFLAAAPLLALRSAETFLRHYRDSVLAFSWKPFCQGFPQRQIKDPLFSFEDDLKMNEAAIGAVVKDLGGHGEITREVVKAIAERIADAIEQQGYEGFAREARSGGLFADGVLGVNEAMVNVIPGDSHGHCSQLLIAVASGGTAKGGMKAIAKRIRLHLTKCEHITQSVLIITDEWKTGIIDESFEDFVLRAGKGVRFSVLMCPQPGRGLVHLPVSIR